MMKHETSLTSATAQHTLFTSSSKMNLEFHTHSSLSLCVLSEPGNKISARAPRVEMRNGCHITVHTYSTKYGSGTYTGNTAVYIFI